MLTQSISRRSAAKATGLALAVASSTTMGATVADAGTASKDLMIKRLSAKIDALQHMYVGTQSHIHTAAVSHREGDAAKLSFRRMQMAAEIRALSYRLKPLQPATLAQETAKLNALKIARAHLAFV